MTHLDEGTILAVRDGAREVDDALEHLAGCAPCSRQLARARTRATEVAEALEALDDDVRVDAAKAVVRKRLDDSRTQRARRGEHGWPALGKAAALVVLAAGAASALPGSPLRTWWEERDGTPVPLAEPTGPSAAPQEGLVGGIAVPLDAGRIAVIVRGAAPGTRVRVEWVERLTASVSAPAGSGFTYGGGRAEVDAAPGALRIELPRTAGYATLEVNGVEYVRRSDEQLDVTGPVTERSDAGVSFIVPER
jgi:hypothetical protein